MTANREVYPDGKVRAIRADLKGKKNLRASEDGLNLGDTYDFQAAERILFRGVPFLFYVTYLDRECR
jgi:hypothetical protein